MFVVAALVLGLSTLGLVYKSNAGSSDKKDIVDTAVSAGSFKTLVAALQAAELVDTLRGDGPFTVFAPTDAAFSKLPAGTVESLLEPKNKAKLQAILTYHVVPGNVMASEVVNLSSAKTVNGKTLKIRVNNGSVMIDNAKVIKTDIATSNGVIHIIDTVVIPD
ncbi:MAG: fasciclin domain-containing protein [Deltaproteobacteria bacterium]|nr:fasciclin domain-containing protein [Deltaproteobacteria bacterium]